MKKSLFNRVIMLMLTFIFSASVFMNAAGKDPFVIVIDAGHGGKDVGAIDNGAKEKDINLGVALQLGEILKKKMKDAKVVFTRTDDTYFTLQQRADKANAAKGNLFISIHTNSLDANNPKRSSVEGASVYVLGLHKNDNNMKVAQRENSVIKLEQNFEEKYEGFDPQRDESYIIFEMAQKKNLANSIKFAELAEKNLQSIGERKGRGVHQAGFWVLWATAMPGALVEVDFICNPKSAAFISSASGQKKLAEALYKSIEQYRKELKIAAKQPQKTEEIVVPAGDAVTLAKSSSNTRVKTEAPKVRASKNGHSGQRRRRSEAARRACENHNYETDYITINTHAEKGIFEGIKSEKIIAATDVDADDETPAKKNRKDRKVKPRKEKKQTKNAVRVVNGREVVMSSNAEPSTLTAKEKSSRAKGKSRAAESTKSSEKSRQENEKIAKENNRKNALAVEKKEITRSAEKKENNKVTAQARSRQARKAADNIRPEALRKSDSDKKKVSRNETKSAEKESAGVRVKNAFSEREVNVSTSQDENASRLNRGSRNRH
ncbi:MAG: hypothetical protein HDS70_07920 [Bacteroidales bacterium]|nr:hypothetical protein [Bacteroidales bacterium]MBD5222272.1 hypothetical protein [Bacteroidales bacterium]